MGRHHLGYYFLIAWTLPLLAAAAFYLAGPPFPLLVYLCVALFFLAEGHGNYHGFPLLGTIGGKLSRRTYVAVLAASYVVGLGVGLPLLHLNLCIGYLAGVAAYGTTRRFLPHAIESALRREAFGPIPHSRVRRGRLLLDVQEVRERAGKSLAASSMKLSWGGVDLPIELARHHFCVVGMTGSGKTNTISLLMRAVLPEIGRRPDSRALIYDAKRDVLSLLAGLGVRDRTIILNPFDRRSHAWNIARDVTSPAVAQQVASILIPEEDGPNRYFSDAARHLVMGVMVAFMRSRPTWSLRDLVLATRGTTRLRRVLESVPETRHLVESYFSQDQRATASVLSTIASRLMPFEPIAALWHVAAVAGRTFSLEEWVRGDRILLLGHDDRARLPLDALNRVIFRRAAELALDQTESETRRVWFFIDELPQAGRLDGLDSLFVKGRSKGVTVVIGFQDIDGLRRPSLYGEQWANEIVGQCGNYAILRLNSDRTAEWASRVIGDAEILQHQRSTNVNTKDGIPYLTNESQSHGINETFAQRTVVMPSEFYSLHKADAGTGELEGFFITPAIGVWRNRYAFAPLMPNRDQGESDFEPYADAREQYLPDWEEPTSPPAGESAPALTPVEDFPRVTRD